MQQRTHKYLYSLLFAGFTGVVGLTLLTSCRDNPDAKAAKEVRKETASALDDLSRDKEYNAAQQKVMATLVRHRAQGLTRDAALLASGNLALSRGILEQANLESLAAPVREGIGRLEQHIRRGEQLMLEKERIEMLLASSEKERGDLQKLMDEGTEQSPALQELRAAAQKEMDTLAAEKAGIQQTLEQTQGTLDNYQSRADELLRQAELAQGEQKLTLQQQGYDLLKERKDYYIQAQAALNQIAVLDSQIELVRARVDGLDESIEQTQSRIDAIGNSQARQLLIAQITEIDSTGTDVRQELTQTAVQITAAHKAYREAVERLLAVFDEAMGEFDKVQTGKAVFTATVRRAETAHQAALACSSLLRLQVELNERLVDLLQSAEPSLAAVVQEQLPIGPLDAVLKQKAMDLFAAAFENYGQAYESAGSVSKDAQCSLLKSHLLAMSHKMRLEDRIGDYDSATQTETALNELITKGTELGVCFTQSEAMRVIENEGLNYLPELPLNIEVLAEGLKQRFSAWKRLPVAEQAQVVDTNLAEIEQLISQYGDALASHLDPLRQEMQSAKDRGFTEAAASSGAASGEPNSLF